MITAVLVALSACGSGDPARPGDTTSPAATKDAVAAEKTAAEKTPADDDEAAIRAAFDAYKAAILGGDGRGAVRWLSADTFDYYEEAQRLALEADEEELRGEKLADQMGVLAMRGLLSAKAVRESSPEELVVTAVEKGLIGTSSVVKSTIGDVTVSGATATAQNVSDGEETPFDYIFVREEGAWRLKLMALLETSEATMHQAAQDQGLTDEELIDAVVVQMLGKAKAAKAWEPIGR
jgi:hypothetical protein